MYFNSCNEIYNHNRMHKSDLVLDKYWLTQSGYFILLITVTLGMGITYGELLFFHVVSDQARDKKFSMREYNSRIVHYFFKKNLSV